MDKNTCRKNFYNILSLYIFFVNQFGRHYNVKPCLLQTDKSRNGIHCNFRAGKDNSFYWPLSKAHSEIDNYYISNNHADMHLLSVDCSVFSFCILFPLEALSSISRCIIWDCLYYCLSLLLPLSLYAVFLRVLIHIYCCER